MLHFLCHLFLLFSSIQPSDGSASWLTVGMVGAYERPEGTAMKPATVCRELPGLNRRQVKFCRRNFDTMASISEGARIAYDECQFQFHKRRWNCSLIGEDGRIVGETILRDGTREAAFVHAISAAGVAYRITKDCSKGRISRCGCDLSSTRNSVRPNADGSYAYRGCSDNVHYGIAVASEFVDAAEKQKNHSLEQRIVNLHNNRAGREVLATNLRRQCKCHGVSGACEVRTCWEALPSFREIGQIIKDKFDGATEVQIIRPDENSRPVMERKNPMFKRHTSHDLVYLNPSPDYCEPDQSRGIFGTHGRPCNFSSMAVDSCDLLCCHRGFDTEMRVVKERCKCKFHYCCRVECQTCERTIEHHTCK
ncbi:Wnt-4 protein precursor [Aphelenchoides besseyi]|nr:Wnt-4 protein precursor [Aphelenchoides besseyi]